MGVLDTLAAVSKARRTVTLVMDAALETQWADLQQQLEAAANEDVQRGSLAQTATAEVVERMEAIREQVQASEVTFAFEPVPWTARVALQAEHPPREGNRLDQLRGYNIETYTPTIIRAACVAVTGADGDEATEVPAKTWDTLLAALSFGQVELLYQAATVVNDGLSKVPPSARFLLGRQDPEASLAQPGPGTSPPEGSTGGNRRTKRKSSATKKAASSA